MKKNESAPRKIHVRRDDTVMVVSGKDKGKKGKVMKVFPKEGRVLVDGINIAKKHTKPRPPKVPQGGILEKAQPVDSSKVMLMCTKCNLPMRVKKRDTPEGKRERICRKCGEHI
ncbi:MAG: 50S ribosomal protein L24 [Candidatus Eremiobacteraeota bacterium]|nr:50S ribosomal protein L24 [Candidatus Eremiobacteraeota bacterium]